MFHRAVETVGLCAAGSILIGAGIGALDITLWGIGLIVVGAVNLYYGIRLFLKYDR